MCKAIYIYGEYMEDILDILIPQKELKRKKCSRKSTEIAFTVSIFRIISLSEEAKFYLLKHLPT